MQSDLHLYPRAFLFDWWVVFFFTNYSWTYVFNHWVCVSRRLISIAFFKTTGHIFTKYHIHIWSICRRKEKNCKFHASSSPRGTFNVRVKFDISILYLLKSSYLPVLSIVQVKWLYMFINDKSKNFSLNCKFHYTWWRVRVLGRGHFVVERKYTIPLKILFSIPMHTTETQ
jgi:hypothetical protein